MQFVACLHHHDRMFKLCIPFPALSPLLLQMLPCRAILKTVGFGDASRNIRHTYTGGGQNDSQEPLDEADNYYRAIRTELFSTHRKPSSDFRTLDRRAAVGTATKPAIYLPVPTCRSCFPILFTLTRLYSAQPHTRYYV